MTFTKDMGISMEKAVGIRAYDTPIMWTTCMTDICILPMVTMWMSMLLAFLRKTLQSALPTTIARITIRRIRTARGVGMKRCPMETIRIIW